MPIKSNLVYFNLFALIFLSSCHQGNKNQATKVPEPYPGVKTTSVLPADDSLSRLVLQTFGLPYSNATKFDSNSLIFSCSRAYDTSSLIEMTRKGKLVKCVYYEILPEYHRFMTDYADTSSKLIFFEGYSFTIDTATWKSVVDRTQIVFQAETGPNKNSKYTDGTTYALYFNGRSRHGNSNDEALFEKFDSFLKSQFLDKYRRLKKPIMYKKK